MKKKNLEDFVGKFENFDSFSHSSKIIHFGYYLEFVEKNQNFDAAAILKCYKALSGFPPANVSDFLSKLKHIKKLVKDGKNYKIERKEIKKIQSSLGAGQSTISIKSDLQKLRNALADTARSNFLNEAIDCLGIRAWHAVLVLVWIITIDHLQDFVLAKDLALFNQILQQNPNYKKTTIQIKEDFESIKDADFLAVIRSCGFISSGQLKILENRLDDRNSYAHPTTQNLTESMTIGFVEDLVHNIILKKPIS